MTLECVYGEGDQFGLPRLKAATRCLPVAGSQTFMALPPPSFFEKIEYLTEERRKIRY